MKSAVHRNDSKNMANPASKSAKVIKLAENDNQASIFDKNLSKNVRSNPQLDLQT